ncbi:hypothetical protein I4F81_012894 [Pyropia yezoensis]|uniref:Uncharacterized protein n=1 Tax=Pyropia yezoensis TaxID=2788 RepID=A0ACC3CJL3_PYRYE|nr:hypothetical protein I4F81_012894 [Neopyropia yezoensis]
MAELAFSPASATALLRHRGGAALSRAALGAAPAATLSVGGRSPTYWASHGCLLMQPHNAEVGAGTFNPATFLRALGPEPWRAAYAEPSVRPDDARYGENPNRVAQHTQFQVVIKPAPADAQALLLGSYAALGIDTAAHDVRFVEDNWASPALGAWGLGWEVWLDGMEITQFTYFQAAGGAPLDAVSLEITYGLERILMRQQGVSHFKDIAFGGGGGPVGGGGSNAASAAPVATYGDVWMQSEVEMSGYYLDVANVERTAAFFDAYEAESRALLDAQLPLPAYTFLVKASHVFNVLDARGAVGVTERARFFGRMRKLARDVAKMWVERREALGFPLLKSGTFPLLPEDAVADDDDGSPAAANTPASSPALGTTETLVFEVGTEELPAGVVTSVITQFEARVRSALDGLGLPYGTVTVDATPRRLAATVMEVATRTPDVVREVRGPPARIAFDAEGAPTKAAAGFLRSNGVTDIGAAEQRDGYLWLSVAEAGVDAVAVLGPALEAAVSGLSFTKVMRWNNSGASFSRPVRSLLALLGTEVVAVRYAGVAADRLVYGLRDSSGVPVAASVAAADDYSKALSGVGVVLSTAERRARITAGVAEVAAAAGGVVPPAYLDGELMDEVVHLVENPLPVRGTFDAAFLGLPADVLITVMRKHQRYFPVEDPASPGTLLPAFVTVGNGNPSLFDEGAVREGNEAVLRARYADAAFFYAKDTAEGVTLASFVPSLAGLTFQEKAGSMLDKTHRVTALVPRLAAALPSPLAASDVADATAAAGLCKADLGTALVVEFTSLAGVMGRHYASLTGEVSAGAATAIYEAVLPRSAADDLPATPAGVLLAVADRLDSLVALFAVGCAPTSAADPYALRRAALGVLSTLRASGTAVSLADAVAAAADVVGTPAAAAAVPDVLAFLSRRLATALADDGLPPDIVRAVLAAGGADNPAAAAATAADLAGLRGGGGGGDAAAALDNALATHARPARLVASPAAAAALDAAAAAPTEAADDPAAVLTAPVEVALLDAVARAEAAVAAAAGVADVVAAMGAVKAPVDAFFDAVMVMADDPAVRAARLGLCARVAALPRGWFDPAELQGV